MRALQILNQKLMKWTKLKINDYLSIIRSDDGFTLIEMLVSLTITCLCFQLVTGIVDQTLHFNEHLQDTTRQQWHLCLNQLEHYLNRPTIEIVNITRKTITVRSIADKNKDDIAYIRKDNSSNFGLKPGHQPFMVDVRLVEFYREDNYLRLELTLINGDQVSGLIYLPKYFQKAEGSNGS